MVLVPANVTSHPAGVVPFVTMTPLESVGADVSKALNPLLDPPPPIATYPVGQRTVLLSPLAVVTTVVVLASKSAVP